MARKDAGPSVNHGPNRWALAAIFTAVVLSLIAFRRLAGDAQAEAQTPTTRQQAADSQRALPRPGHPQHDVMAIVNGQDISRQALAQACVERHGEEVLESLVNKRLIQHHCHNRGINVTDAEIDVEVTRMAERFKITREQWIELLKNERNITAEEYKRDILWPTLALRKLAAKDLEVSQAELQKAYEMRYGPSVQARLIVVSDAKRAAELQRQLAANPDDFARVAMQESEDEGSASIGGLIQPIRRHLAGPEFEKIAFDLQQNQVSAVAPIGDQFAILKCEGHLPGANTPLEMVRNELTEQIREEKLREVANNLFATLQRSATIKNIYNDPQLRQQMPGVVATVNGEQVAMADLGKECLLRHGDEVLEMEISQLLLRQELKRANITVTDAEVQAEMAHAATLAGVVDPQGKPDMQAWVKAATEEQGVSYDLYVRDSVWPSAALKKLTGGSVQVTTDDLQKGFEANYGERVRCRAIVLGDMRRAQEVWSKARRDGSIEFFGKLAAEYSIEPTSKNLEGEVPPLRRNGGQPQLEDTAFALKPGEMSGIVQVADKYVILFCEGRTEPVSIRPDEVRDVLTRDIFEKKIRIAMADRFEMIRKSAKIDNYLAGTSQSPATKQAGTPARVDSAVRQTSDQR
ncbi:Foldase protein PrsA 2 precursor [Pirellulimonas nuda]|uniref:peptidylprolyl isomerase n=1 Tax=Pirellulimonas nuda TaxID=2528009 RepID=A0A518DGV7_9BACT|nr:peptidylprolyl isomerase [Pirellulimonas nuda]QDU90715.1 Foldase protein PrsA 2 precursor [Pirellulimonas nuda]